MNYVQGPNICVNFETDYKGPYCHEGLYDLVHWACHLITPPPKQGGYGALWYHTLPIDVQSV